MTNDPLGLFDEDSNSDPLGLFEEDSKDKKFLSHEEKQKAIREGLAGIVDTGMGMISGLPSQIVGGLGGLSTLAATGSLDKANAMKERIEESNFGMGRYKPFTNKGQEFSENTGNVLQVPIDLAGKYGGKAGSLIGLENEGELTGRLLTEAAMNLIEPGAALGLAKGAIRRAGKPHLPETVVEPKVEPVVPAKDPLGLFDQTTVERLAAGDETGQMALFDQPELMGQRNQFNAGDLGDWRIDENGMPVRVDKSMEAANVEAPLQRNLFGDELPTNGLEGTDIGITQAIDNTPANGQWAQRRGMINRLGGNGKELLASPELEAAMMEANGLKLPFEEQTAFDPKNPLPTRRLGELSSEDLSRLTRSTLPENPPTSPALLAAQANNIFTGQGIAAGRGYGFTQPKGTPESKLFSNFADQPGQNTPEFREKMFRRANADPKQFANDPVQTHIEQYNGKLIRVETTGSGRTRIQVEINGEIQAAAMLHSGMIDSIAVNDAGKGAKLGEELLNYIHKREIGNVYEVPDRSPGFVQIQKNVLSGRTQRRLDASRWWDSQTALASTPLDPRDRPPIVDSVASPRSPETIAAREQNRRVAERLPVKEGPLSEFEAVATPEEAVSMATANGFKDNAPTVVGKTVGSGPRYAAIMTNNPIIKYANTALTNAYRAADKFSSTYLTSKDGLSTTWSKMNDVEKGRVREALLDGDKRQARVTDAEMIQRGFSDMERRLVNKYYEANEAMFQRWNQVLAEQGHAPIARREGHVPGIFKGAYKALVTDEKGVTGVIAADSVYELNAAKRYFAEKHPNYTVVDQGRKGLADYKNQSDIFSGMNDILQLLAEHDPKFREVQAMVNEAIKHGNNSIYAFNKHELSKKGVLGNVGNKPWLDAKKNTDQWFKSMIQYFEEGAQHHELQGPLNAIDKLATDPNIPMPKTKEFLNHLTAKVEGKNAGNGFAVGANWAIDAGPKALGFGPRQSLQLAGAVKNRINELFMGWGNFVFTGVQILQPLQTGLPFLQLAGGRLGKNLSAPKAMFNGGTSFLLMQIEEMTGKNLGKIVPEYQREAYKYAKEVGMLSTNEMERAYEGTKGKWSQRRDAVAGYNIKLGDKLSRTPMFMAFVDMLHDTGIPMDRVLTTADNLTQFSMIDYHQLQRPELYSKAGTLGQFAGGLTTFKHGYMSQLAKLAQEASPVDVTVRKNNGMDRGIKLKPAQIAPAGLSAAAVVAFAGLTGAPFYDELDNVFGVLTDKFGGKRENIRDAFLKNLPEWVKSGAISNISNVAIQSKFSSANMIPDTIPKLLSPHLSAAYDMGEALIDVAKNGDKQAWDNALMAFSPSTLKGAVEDWRLTDPNGLVHNKQGEGTVVRSPEGRELRKWTGLRPTDEVVQREKDFKARQAEQADAEAKKKIGIDFSRKVTNSKPINEMTPEELEVAKMENQAKAQEYAKRGGDPKSLVKLVEEKALAQKTTEEARRAQGIKPTIGSMRKQEYYNKPGER